ncbi:5-carboxymethyl-2-hydroxymuconate Delta-isomerase [Planktomarina sp.]|uniref:5-carboxymethyl-2-hydroxymuconate Delta-isomerase n=1 Tax=Planktomarina sp. TaxID=2024851 RepID=UPI00288D8458|nr:5-carboxymethyl-2-hydroxymuconate Delta-isomerase [Planktomarina sp.]MDT2031078.1 5-carboxymethyl-2-hydroxymuconate Delta-isomerase [Planktomarina sp.]MDT2069698.1 5-carboxymethyl-2-hydroxymuconate Delta-isomerase [Planktomarina sp.]
MPHLTVQYSQNLDHDVDMGEFCSVMNAAMQETGVFPLAGIRVRAHPMPQYSVADGHSKNAFVDMVLRMGEGRSDATKSEVGAFLMARAEAVFAPLLVEPYFALSLEIGMISKPFSWKTNSINTRINTPFFKGENR